MTHEKEAPRDINELLAPISEDRRCGEYLKYDNVYDRIKELRREDDLELSKGIWQIELKKAEWPEVDRVCSDLIKTRTKDLQIAMWLTESWAVMERFFGFNRGINLLLSLCEKFWYDIYPLIDEKNKSFTARLSPFYFLAEKMHDRLVLIPIVELADSTVESRSLSDWMTARYNLRTKNMGGLSLEQLKKSVMEVPLEFFQSLKTDIEQTMESLKNLDSFLTAKCSTDSPSFGKLFECLEDIINITNNNMKETKVVKALPSPSVQITQGDDSESTVEILELEPMQSFKQNRPNIEQAYATMAEIAIFLEKEQPQSPAATLIKIAGAIGKKNFQELMEINMKSGTSVIGTISELYRVLCT
ncbi:MAG: type VI secretion system protein TssA [Holosporaceae bacterium]|jgi:type VI secretion system protein ImpA|nr:type VI secretion system protein TssA [Holosporaceae bacterium]